VAITAGTFCHCRRNVRESDKRAKTVNVNTGEKAKQYTHSLLPLSLPIGDIKNVVAWWCHVASNRYVVRHSTAWCAVRDVPRTEVISTLVVGTCHVSEYLFQPRQNYSSQAPCMDALEQVITLTRSGDFPQSRPLRPVGARGTVCCFENNPAAQNQATCVRILLKTGK
jgi:hypothetical protein